MLTCSPRIQQQPLVGRIPQLEAIDRTWIAGESPAHVPRREPDARLALSAASLYLSSDPRGPIGPPCVSAPIRPPVVGSRPRPVYTRTIHGLLHAVSPQAASVLGGSGVKRRFVADGERAAVLETPVDLVPVRVSSGSTRRAEYKRVQSCPEPHRAPAAVEGLADESSHPLRPAAISEVGSCTPPPSGRHARGYLPGLP